MLPYVRMLADIVKGTYRVFPAEVTTNVSTQALNDSAIAALLVSVAMGAGILSLFFPNIMTPYLDFVQRAEELRSKRKGRLPVNNSWNKIPQEPAI
jgi:hypothetical protein